MNDKLLIALLQEVSVTDMYMALEATANQACKTADELFTQAEISAYENAEKAGVNHDDIFEKEKNWQGWHTTHAHIIEKYADRDTLEFAKAFERRCADISLMQTFLEKLAAGNV